MRALKEELDGGIKGGGHRDHDFGTKNPKDVVEEETHEHDGASSIGAKGHELDGLDGKGDAKEVVGEVVARLKVPHRDDGRDEAGHNVGKRKLEVELVAQQPVQELGEGTLCIAHLLLLHHHRTDHNGVASV